MYITAGTQFCMPEYLVYRCTPEAKELTYTSLVCSLMEFAAPAWGQW